MSWNASTPNWWAQTAVPINPTEGGVENLPPELDAIGNKSVQVNNLVTFTATASDDGLPAGILNYSLEDGAGGSVPTGASIGAGTGIFEWTPDTTGSYTFDICVSDGSLNDCETITITVTPNSTPPTQSSFWGEIHYQVDDGGPIAGEDIEAYIEGVAALINSASIIDAGGGLLAYTINVNGDDIGTAEKDGGVQDDVVIFKINGRVVATGTWIDMANTQLDIHPPKADAGGAYAVLLEDGSLTLDGSFMDYMDDGFTYAWDLDDDSDYDDASTITPVFAYSTVGTYEVSLKVTDGQGGEGYDDTQVFVLELDGLVGQYFDGNPHAVTVSGVEAPYTYTVLYGNTASETPPTEAGTYEILVQIKLDDDVLATISAELIISGTSHEIDLVAGWNLISFRVIPYSTSVEDVLSSIESQFSLVYAWDASGTSSSSGHWLKYDPNVAYGNSLTNLDESMGFWIYMTQAATLTVIGEDPTETIIPLQIAAGGWNLVGYPSSTNLDLPGALSDQGGTGFTLIYAYHAADTSDPWKLFDVAVTPVVLNDLTTMSPGWGYWIDVNTDADWTVNN